MDNPIKTIEEMQAIISKLEEENAELRMHLEYRSKGKRDVFNNLKNREKAIKLCAIGCKKGRLYHSMANFPSNFQTLYKNIFRALNPTVVKTAKGNDVIRYTSLTKISESDYQIHKECLETCIEAIYNAKAKLKKCETIAISAKYIEEE